MSTVKERIIEIVKEQPEDSSYEEILKELAFAKMIERGLKDSDAGRTHSNEAVKEKIKKWQR
jgi:predicted transcriptional regulator